jgi:hypothetical protein
MQDRQVRQQLGEIELGIDLVAAAGTGQAGQDSSGSSASRVADEERILPAMEIFP